MPNPVCCYFQKNEECAFCSLKPHQHSAPVPPSIVAKAATIALKQNPNYELALSGGTSDTPDRSASYFMEIAQKVRMHSNMPISVELVPPEDMSFLDGLMAAGVTSVIMNVEIWSQELQSVYCPGKSRISLEHYMASIEHGVKVFGRGQVASALIAGIQAPSAVIDGAREIIMRGAIPTIIPFKPFDRCKMANAPRCNPEDVTEIHRAVSKLLAEAQLGPRMQKGCTGCGGCSLENMQVGGAR